jgi:hypothetical protein
MRRIAGLALGVALLAGCARAAPPLAGPEPAPTSPGPDLAFVLEHTYTVGEHVAVKLRNQGTATYEYNSTGYEACDLTYTDASGREFLIPPGTHCDLIHIKQLRPGETVTLFNWKLDECTKDDWGCLETRTLPPGTYTIAGEFERVGGGKTSVETSIQIVD